jgi:hypothetical protein
MQVRDQIAWSLPSLILRLLARPSTPSSAGSRERPPSPNFPQLYIVEPSNGFNKGLRSTSNLNLQDSPRPGLGGSHHLPPYSIVCASPRGPHPNGILSHDSQMGVPKLLKSSIPQLCGPITLCADLWLRWGLKQSCSPRQETFNSMLHATYTQGNLVDS